MISQESLDSMTNFYYLKSVYPDLYKKLQHAESQSVSKLKSSATYLREALSYFIDSVFIENKMTLPKGKDEKLKNYEEYLENHPVKGILVDEFSLIRRTCNAIIHCDEKKYQQEKRFVSHHSLEVAFDTFNRTLWRYYSNRYSSKCNSKLFPEHKYNPDYSPVNSWQVMHLLSNNNILGFDREFIGCRIQSSGTEYGLIRQYPASAYFINRTSNSFASRETGTGKEIRSFVNHPSTLSVPSVIETIEPQEEDNSQKKRLILYPLGTIEPYSLLDKELLRNLSLSEKFSIMNDIAKALRFLHQKNMSHRGLTPNTVFVMKGDSENDIHAVLTSLEHCKLPDSEQTVKGQMKKNKNVFSAYTYYSSSMLEKIQSGEDETVSAEDWKKEDIYSLGAVFWYLLYENVPSKRILWGNNIHSLDEELLNTFSAMTSKNPDLRPDINQVYKSLKQYDGRDD